MKRIFTAANLPEAHLLVHLLAERGIRARIFNANASSLAGELPVNEALPQVWVEEPSQAAYARATIDDYFRAASHAPPRACPRCGEENPGSFDLCWSCGEAL